MKTYLTLCVIILSLSITFANESISFGNAADSALTQDVLFNTSTHTITNNELTAYLAVNKAILFTIQDPICCTKGRTDSKDKETGKKNLSQVKDKFIHDALVMKGVNASRKKCKNLKGAISSGNHHKSDRKVKILIRTNK